MWNNVNCYYNTDMFPCEHQMPCQNGANCTNNGSNGQYICKCSSGYTGSDCEDDINECLTEPCHNDSTCIVRKLYNITRNYIIKFSESTW